MSDQDAELGPIDYIVVEFPAGTQNFSGAMAAELAKLVESGQIRVLDLVVLDKAADGSVDVLEFEDIEDLGELAALEGQLAEVLAAEDMAHLAASMDPGTVGIALIWENTWAAPFAVAARTSGGQLVASGRVPTQALIAAVSADEAGD